MTRAPLLPAIILALGCSSSEPAPAPAPDVGYDPFETSGATGTYGTREETCARITGALTKRASELGCGTVIGATCPKYVDDLEATQGVAGKCMEYDLGTVTNCEARIASYVACADFNSKPCQLTLRQSATATCTGAAVDAASEGG